MAAIGDLYYRFMRTIVSRFVVLGMWLSLVLACSIEDAGPRMATKKECEELRSTQARLVTAAGAPVDGTRRESHELAQHAKSLALAGGEEWLVRCTKDRTAASIECARQAVNLHQLERCAAR
jgi:hypothetical protein